jgi:hypothetical protein
LEAKLEPATRANLLFEAGSIRPAHDAAVAALEAKEIGSIGCKEGA